MENNNQNNYIKVSGMVVSEPTPSHEVYGEEFYNFNIECTRLSDVKDTLPVTISNRLFDPSDIKVGNYIEINAQIRSYNYYSEGKTHLILTIFVKDLCEKVDLSENDKNDVKLNGYICKPPVYRTTPFGREIADVLLAVNRAYNKSDYIPIICWGRNARFVSKLEVGSNIAVSGRMQSRIYHKKIDEENVVEKTAYEVSISKIEHIINE